MLRKANDDSGRESHLPLPLGEVRVTLGAMEAIESLGVFPPIVITAMLRRHASGDWGDLCQEDWQLNDDALRNGGRILSAYILRDETRYWVITEWDRSVTTILLPEEY